MVTEESKIEMKVPLKLELGPQSALVAIDVRTRQVIALVVSYEGLPGGFDRATQSRSRLNRFSV